MKGADTIKMTLNIGGEIIKLDVKFDDQNDVRDSERAVKQYIDKLKKTWPDISQKKSLAMAAYQFANWCHQLQKIQNEAMDIVKAKSSQIDNRFEETSAD